MSHAAETPATRPLVGVYYYPWYGTNLHWKQGYIEAPELGFYSNLDPKTFEQHIRWAKQGSIDFFVMSWWGAGHYTDRALRDYYIKLPSPLPFALFYEIHSRFKGETVDFNAPANRATLANDFVVMARTYFSHPAYLRIDNKPVVFIYLTRVFQGDVAAAIEEVKAAVAKEGFEPFLVADEVYYGNVNKARASLFNAVTAYNMHTATLVEDDIPAFLSKTEAVYAHWMAATLTMPSTVFIPNAMPGFDDTGVRPEAKHPKLKATPENFAAFIQLALRYVDPRLPMLVITSFNEWHENTQIEPSRTFGTKYLDVLQSMLQ